MTINTGTTKNNLSAKKELPTGTYYRLPFSGGAYSPIRDNYSDNKYKKNG